MKTPTLSPASSTHSLKESLPQRKAKSVPKIQGKREYACSSKKLYHHLLARLHLISRKQPDPPPTNP